jgi:hypothetical protein
MKRHLTLLLSIAVAAVLVHAWVARKPAPPAPQLAAVSARQAPSTRQLAVAAVDAAAASQDRDRQISLEIERAVLSNDAGRRETAFAVLMPELLRAEPGRVVDMVARQPPGESRDALVHEVARQWITRDTEAAVAWLQSLGEERGPAGVAVRALAAVSPAQAIDVADRLGVGRDDGSVEHILQIWAAESPREARRWLERQQPR